MDIFLPLLERLGVPIAFLAIAVISLIRGDVVPKYIHERVLSDLDRERRDTDRFLEMCIRLLEDTRNSQSAGQEAVRVMRAQQHRRKQDRDDREESDEYERVPLHPERPISILDRERRVEDDSEPPRRRP